MFRLLIARGTNFLFAVALLLVALTASMLHLLARPHLLSWPLTLAFYWILDSTELARDARQAQSGCGCCRVLMLLLGEPAWQLSAGVGAGGDILGVGGVETPVCAERGAGRK